jgi:DNA-binding HxlR family transcriptional regulator
MKSYGQYCPIARGSEVFAERWTPIIVRNLYLGCRTFTEIQAGAPGIPKALLTARLVQLTELGVVERQPGENGRGWRYSLSPCGEELFDVCEALGNWGSRWLELAPRDLDPYLALWAIAHSLDAKRLPRERLVIRFEFPDQRRHRRFWLLVERGEAEVCVGNPGHAEDLVVEAESEAFVRWHLGHLSWSRALADRRIRTTGPRALVRAFLSWGPVSRFAEVQPAPGIADSSCADDHRRP